MRNNIMLPATLPKKVKIVEVGPRDGLQNETRILDVATKVNLIEGLANAGLQVIEAGSFVSPRWVPQMANSDQVFRAIAERGDVAYPVLVPNVKGMENALRVGVRQISCFTAASEAFNQKNINCSISESLERIKPLTAMAAEKKLPVRAYVSCVAGCPYQGKVSKEEVARVVVPLLAMGCYEISLGDTIGVATPGVIVELIEHLAALCPKEKLALHLHDTYGQALANIYAGLQMGIGVFDSSVAGLGGCPYADGASGNVATEDLVYLLNGLGIESGVDLEALVDVGEAISRRLNRVNRSRVGRAVLAKKANTRRT